MASPSFRPDLSKSFSLTSLTPPQRRLWQASVGKECDMPFSKYSVDPEQIEALRAAFYRVCDVLQLSGEVDDRMTEVVAMKIMELAKGGELDPERLCVAVLASLDSSKRADDA